MFSAPYSKADIFGGRDWNLPFKDLVSSKLQKSDSTSDF